MPKPPKTVPCPTCDTDVKVPRDAEPGDELTCPGCDEVFTPPELRKTGYDPAKETSYGVGRAAADPDRAKKATKARALMKHGRKTLREERDGTPKPFFGGFELVMLIVAGVATVALAIGYTVAKRAPNTGEGILLVLAYCAFVGVFVAKMLLASKRIGG